jgi:hypothetical protein
MHIVKTLVIDSCEVEDHKFSWDVPILQMCQYNQNKVKRILIQNALFIQSRGPGASGNYLSKSVSTVTAADILKANASWDIIVQSEPVEY